MTKLEQLIEELCPNGVEYRTLNTICNVYDGTHQTPQYTDSGIKFASVENIADPYATEKYISVSDYEKYKIKPHRNDLLMTRIGSIGVCTVIESDEPLAYYVSLALLRPDNSILNSRYLKYAIESLHCRKELRKRTLVNAVPIKINMGDIGKITLPVPPLPVQREIVRILDNFTELTTELTAELTARKKQYEFYRDKLLDFAGNTDVKNVPLGDIAKFVYGYTDKAKETGSVRFVRITDISEDGRLNPYDAKYVELTDESKKYLLKKGDLLLARTGATYGKTLYFEEDEPAVYASFLIKIILDNSVIKNRYYWHFSKSSLYWEQAERYVSKGGQQQFNTNAVSRVIVPIPSLEVQDRIIYVLDNFDAICTDLSSGLPAEIEARQKQYEYYRDKLLSFEEKI